MTRRLLFLLLTLALLALAPACEGDGEGTLPPVGDDDSSADDDDAGDDDDATPPPTYPESITLTTADGKTLQGTWQDAPGVDNGPAVVFLHQITRDRQDFQTVWFNFLDAGISVLAFDFRGHGSSDDADLDMIDLLTTPGHLEHDMDAAIAFAAEQDVVDPSRIGVFGLDVGANLAILASHRADLDVKIICAVSADVAAVEALGETTVDQLQLSGALYVSAENEQPQATDAQTFFDLTVEPRDIELVLGTDDHGHDLLSGSGDAQVGIPAWFEAQL